MSAQANLMNPGQDMKIGGGMKGMNADFPVNQN